MNQLAGAFALMSVDRFSWFQSYEPVETGPLEDWAARHWGGVPHWFDRSGADDANPQCVR